MNHHARFLHVTTAYAYISLTNEEFYRSSSVQLVMMRALTALCFTLAVISLSEAYWGYFRRSRTLNVGERCSPRYVATCGPRRVVSQSITAATDFG